MLAGQRGAWLATLAYDGANRVAQTLQNGRTVNYVYDIPGRPHKLRAMKNQKVDKSQLLPNVQTVPDGIGEIGR